MEVLILGRRQSWRAGADCKSVGIRLWGFESLAAHNAPQNLIQAGVTQLVESQPSKLLVASSSLVSRSNTLSFLFLNTDYSTYSGQADVAQLVEHILGKDEVTGSIPVVSSI